VSSFGLGGTNAHVIVEQPPDPPARREPKSAGRYELLVLSARTASALDSTAQRLAAHLTGPEGTADLAAIASTLDVGRHRLPVRRCVVTASAADAADRLPTAATPRTVSGKPPGVFFLFPGHGSQYPAMAAGLDHYEPAFAEALDTCAELVADATDGADLRKMLVDPTLSDDLVAGALSTFCVEWATACLWRAWGVEPAGVLGHSLGGIVAACVAGVLTPAEAIGFVATRSRLLAGLPSGAMLAVQADEAQLGSLLPRRVLTDLSLAALNGPGNCVLAGSRQSVEAAFAWLHEHGTEAKVLRIPAAGHSRAIEPILDELRQAAARLNPRPPTLPWVSETTGTWVDDASTPEWWVAHTRQTVRFGTAIGQVLQRPGTVLLEVGPGGVLGALTRRHPGYDGRLVCSSLPHAGDPTEAHPYLLEAAGRLWCAGVEVQWRHGAGRRVSLPGYPFARTEYAPDSGPASPPADPRPPAVPPADNRHTDLADTAVATAFARVLGVDDLTGEDDFFDLGGDSLIATQLVAFLKAGWGIDLTPGTLFRARTVAAFTDVVRRTAQEQDRP
jgi:phthiocerol/phenolphthiocerol synthesis type-I polyketide synthase E